MGEKETEVGGERRSGSIVAADYPGRATAAAPGGDGGTAAEVAPWKHHDVQGLDSPDFDKAGKGHDKGDPVEATTVKSGKSNSSDRVAAGDLNGDSTPDDAVAGGGPEPAEATNLNSSKSNIYRSGEGAGEEGGGGAAEATTVKGSKSNTSERLAGGVDEGADRGPLDTNLNSSRSNIYRAVPPGGGVDPTPADLAVSDEGASGQKTPKKSN